MVIHHSHNGKLTRPAWGFFGVTLFWRLIFPVLSGNRELAQALLWISSGPKSKQVVSPKCSMEVLSGLPLGTKAAPTSSTVLEEREEGPSPQSCPPWMPGPAASQSQSLREPDVTWPPASLAPWRKDITSAFAFASVYSSKFHHVFALQKSVHFLTSQTAPSVLHSHYGHGFTILKQLHWHLGKKMRQIRVFKPSSWLGGFRFILSRFFFSYLVTFCSTHPTCLYLWSIRSFYRVFYLCVVAIQDSWGTALITCQAWHLWLTTGAPEPWLFLPLLPASDEIRGTCSVGSCPAPQFSCAGGLYKISARTWVCGWLMVPHPAMAPTNLAAVR